MEARKIQMGRRFQAAALFAFALSVCAIVAAQVRVDVRLVNVIVTVTDSHGRYIPNLSENDFIVEEDGKPQHISHFSQARNVPVSVGILLDTSGSMDRQIRTAVDAVDAFVRGIHQHDEFFLMTVLRAFAENSGGRAFLLRETLIGRGGQIEKILSVIAEELRSQYTLGYYPPRADDGLYHSIRIRTRAGDAVRARHGYLARSS